MPAVIAEIKRDDLVQEILDALRQWPELERRVFSQAHYHGQSPEAISRSLQLGVEDVNAILQECERRLHASLRNFINNGCEKPSLTSDEAACPAACAEALQGPHALAFTLSHALGVAHRSF